MKYTVFDIVKYSNRSNTNLELAAKLVVAYDSIARGGEIKFQKFSDWNIYSRTNVLYTKWNELKTIQIYAIPCIPDKRWWFVFYYMMGAYAMCRNGLFRNNEQIKAGLEYTVLQSLYKVSDSYVATILSKSIRKSLILQINNGA